MAAAASDECIGEAMKTATRPTTRRRRSAMFVLLLCVATTASCDDDDDGGSSACGTAPCGGDVMGAWSVQELCDWDTLAESFASEDCPSLSADLSGIGATGTANLDSGGTYSFSMTMSGSMTITYPEECLTVNGVTLTCEQLNQGVQQAMMEDPSAAVMSIQCSGSSGCSCTAEMTPMQIAETGTYAASGTTLTTTTSGGSTSSSSYCVTGSLLVMTDADPNGDAPTMVLQRQ